MSNTMSDLTVSAVDRCLLTLEILVTRQNGVTVTELSSMLGAGKSVVFRILSSLRRHGFVTQDELTQVYQPTFKIVALAHRLIEGTNLNTLSLPVLRRLAEGTTGLARLAVVEGEAMIWIASVDGSRSGIRVVPQDGQEVWLHATAAGKVWLASLPEDRAIAVAAKEGLVARTPNTITSIEGLLQELREVRQQGYATAYQEAEVGVVAVAAPIKVSRQSGGERVVGAVAVAGTIFEFPEKRIETFVQDVIAAATELSQFWLLNV